MHHIYSDSWIFILIRTVIILKEYHSVERIFILSLYCLSFLPAKIVVGVFVILIVDRVRLHGPYYLFANLF